jgi:sugar transferase (PEP-CTERM/EpsH1 system associated)
MKILYIVHRIPYPPNKGEKVRSFHQIQYLSKNHTIHLICLADEPDYLQYVQTLEKYCASVDVVYRDRSFAKLLAILALFTRRPLSVGSFYSRKLQKIIFQKLGSEKFDVALVFCSSMAEYIRRMSAIPKVIDFVDVDSEKWRLYANHHPFPVSWIYRLEADRLARYEMQIARDFHHSIFASEKEAGHLRCRVEGKTISAIPNGVDLDYFTPHDHETSDTDQPIIAFTGTMDYFPNVDAVRYFCREIFPLIRHSLPEAKFYIIGRRPTPEVRRLADLPNVIVTGSVTDVREYLARARVAVAPLRIARGVQNKILEAMAMGRPVVGTSSAFQGIQATLADGIWIADDPQAFAEAVLTLIQDQDLHRHCSFQARSYVQRYHQWPDHCAQLELILQQASTLSDLSAKL